MSKQVDIVIVGGGMVGGAFAGLAANAGLRVAVLDAGAEPAPPGAAYGARVVALSRASELCLEKIGAWNRLDAQRVLAYAAMRVWDAAGTPFDDDALVFDCAQIGEPNLGHIVENDAIAAATFAAVSAHANVRWYSDTPVADIAIGERNARVHLACGDTLAAPLVVAADGAQSVCRTLADIETRAGQYGQRAIVTHVSSSEAHQATAWQRFLPRGPLALLPLADGRSSIVWSTSAEEASDLEALDDAAFCARLTDASVGVLGQIESCTPRRSFPLQWLHASQYTRARFALIGDAAHVVHPLAGLGVNLGLLDAVALVDVVQDARDRGRDLGDESVLRRYARWRKAENAAVLNALSALNSLFAQDNFLVSSVRRLGMRAVNRAAPVKRRLIRHALGLGAGTRL